MPAERGLHTRSGVQQMLCEQVRRRETCGSPWRWPQAASASFRNVRSGGSDVVYIVDGPDASGSMDTVETMPFNVAYAHRAREGALLAVCDEPGNVTLVDSDAQSARQVSRLQPHSNAVFAAVFAGDDTYVATASGDQTARIVDVETGVATDTLAGHMASVKAVCISPANSAVLATAARDGMVLLWDLRCSAYAVDPLFGNAIHKPVDIIRRVHADCTEAAVVSPPALQVPVYIPGESYNGKATIESSGEDTHEYKHEYKHGNTEDNDEGEKERDFQNAFNSISMQQLSTQNSPLARTGSGVPSLSGSPSSIPRMSSPMMATPHRRRVMTGNNYNTPGSGVGSASSHIKNADMVQSQMSASSVTILDGGSSTGGCGFSIATCGVSDGSIKLWDIRNIGSLAHKRNPTPSLCVKPHEFVENLEQKGSTFNANSYPRYPVPSTFIAPMKPVRTNLQNGKPVNSSSKNRINGKSKQSAGNSNNNTNTNSSNSNMRNPFTIADGSSRNSNGANSESRGNLGLSSISPFMTGSPSNSSSSSSSPGMKQFQMHRRKGFSSMVKSPDCKTLYTVSTDNYIYEVNSSTLRPVRRFNTQGYSCGSFYVKLDVSDKYLIAGSSSYNVYAWNLQDLSETLVLGGHTGEVTGVSLRRRGRNGQDDMGLSFASCSDDNSTRIWKPRFEDEEEDRACLEGIAMDWDGLPKTKATVIEQF